MEGKLRKQLRVMKTKLSQMCTKYYSESEHWSKRECSNIGRTAKSILGAHLQINPIPYSGQTYLRVSRMYFA